jgi:hypothetical protein
MDNIKRDETMRSLRNKPAASTEALFSKSSSSFRGRGRGRGGRQNASANTGKWCTHCQRNNHTTEECRTKHYSNKRPREDDDNVDNEDHRDDVCWYCGDQGHLSRNCPTKKKGKLAKIEYDKKRNIGNDGGKEVSANLTVGTRSAGNGQ